MGTVTVVVVVTGTVTEAAGKATGTVTAAVEVTGTATV